MNHRAQFREFEEIFQAYYTPAVNYCITMLRDKTTAEDIVQQVFVTLWQKRDEINIHTSARAYLYKAVYHASLDFIKHEKIKEQHRRHSIGNMQEAVYNDMILEKELDEKIEDAINQLPEQCGIIFRMSRFRHLKYREIAKELNISEKTVENQVGKALKLLKELLKDYFFLWIIMNHL